MSGKGIILIRKYKETILYLIFGTLTVIVNMMLFALFDLLGFSLLLSNSLAFVLAVLFAYYTNTKFVFAVAFTKANFLQFFGMRIMTILIDNGGMLLLVQIGAHKYISKVIVNAVIIILNYIFSKFYIFKKKEEMK